MADVPSWQLKGEWFDVCRCAVPCPCTFAQPPTDGECDGLLFWHINEGRYGDVTLDGFNFAAIAYFAGNIWDDDTKADMGFFIDERADDAQREAMQAIFSGQAGGWPANFAAKLGNMLGMEPAEIRFEVADDLSGWRAEIPGKAAGRGRTPSGPHLGARQADQGGRPAWLGSRPGKRRHLRNRDHRFGRRIRPQLGPGRPLEQAHGVRVVGARRVTVAA